MNNAYKILGLESSASEEDIKKAYKKLALQYHPDKCNESGANEKFLEIQKAYEELTSNVHKQEIEKVYAKNIFYECKITLRDVYLQNTKKFNIKRSCICKDCHLICNHCGGFGFIKDHLKFGPFIQVLQQNCFKCSTNGVILNLKNDCTKCIKGDVIEEQLINLKIDSGNSCNLKQIVINNWGSQPTRKNELPGDLIISFYVLEDPNFKRINNDLIFNCNITLKESIIGKILIIPHYSETITIDISIFGIINPKKQYTISNKGFSQNGHLHIKFNIIYPDKILNEKEKYIIKDALSCIE